MAQICHILHGVLGRPAKLLGWCRFGSPTRIALVNSIFSLHHSRPFSPLFCEQTCTVHIADLLYSLQTLMVKTHA